MQRTIVLVLLAVLAPGAAAPQGTPVGPEFLINSHTTGAQDLASVAADSVGNFVVVWSSLGQDGGGSGVFGQRYDGSGVPRGSEFRVNTYTTNDQVVPAVASGDSGNFVVVWSSDGQDGAGAGVFGQRYASTGLPLGAEFRVNTYTTDAQWMPAVASDSNGNFVVVWDSYQQDGSFWGVFGQRYASSGAALGPEFRVNSYTPAQQQYASVAADGSGRFVVAWESFQDGSLYSVAGQRYASSGAPLGSEFRINTFTTYGQTAPSVAADDAGNFVVIWQSQAQDGSSWGVFGQRYDSTGTALGPEFRANTSTTDGQNRASVTADAAGDFVVVWTSYGQDGASYAVVGQRYTPILPVTLTDFDVE